MSAFLNREGRSCFWGTMTLYLDPNGIAQTDASGVLRSGSEGVAYPGITDVYYGGDWSTRREAEFEYYRWFSGQKLAETSDEVDPATNEQMPKWPLGYNPIAKYCRVHRAVTIGTVDDYTEMPVKMVFNNDADGRVAGFVNSVLVDNNGPTILNEAALLTQVFGGHVLKVAFDPFNTQLAYRIRVESIRSPYFYPIYDPTDYWNLREAYIGYLITAQVAMSMYNIEKPRGMWVLYMEHWSPTEFKITVDGRVPKVQNKVFEGKHNYGRVPVIYIPHMRQGGFFGQSHVPDLIGLTREQNARMADGGDAIYGTAHPTPIVRNLMRDIKMVPFASDNDGNIISSAVDLGAAPNAPNSHDPDAYLMDMPTTTIQSVSQYQALLQSAALQQADVAPVLIGTDDTASGRITGPVSNMRAAASVQHAQAERMELSAGLKHLANIIQRVALGHAAEYKTIGISVPVNEADLALQCKTIWAPMLPVERIEQVNILNSRLAAGGISLESYLEELHVQDVPKEAERIWADLQRKAEIAGSVTIAVAQLQAEVQEKQAEAQAQSAEAQAKAAARQQPSSSQSKPGAATGKK